MTTPPLFNLSISWDDDLDFYIDGYSNIDDDAPFDIKVREVDCIESAEQIPERPLTEVVQFFKTHLNDTRYHVEATEDFIVIDEIDPSKNLKFSYTIRHGNGSFHIELYHQIVDVKGNLNNPILIVERKTIEQVLDYILE